MSGSIDYDDFDDLLVDAIRHGRVTFGGICSWILAPDEAQQSVHWRRVDRRLQALRKRGVIAYKRPEGWQVVGPE